MCMFNATIIGWDIGGAHLKAALLDTTGNVLHVLQLPCPLWRGLPELTVAMQNMLNTFDIEAEQAQHAITMTGELVDLFEYRHAGVCEIAKLAGQILGENIKFYVGQDNGSHCFVSLTDVPRFASTIASANWHASATFLAQHAPNALLIDIGSTTSDIIPIINGAIALNGNSDSARLKNDTLVYTGVVRTPVMALAQKLPFENSEINVMAELFATMADVYRLTGELPAQFDISETADGKGKTQLESARRLARMVGNDVDNNLEEWILLAFSCKSLQMTQLKTAITQHLKPNMTIIGAGAGSFLVKQIAEDLNHPFTYAYDLVSMRAAGPPWNALVQGHANKHDIRHNIDLCFPAFAVASLALKQSIC